MFKSSTQKVHRHIVTLNYVRCLQPKPLIMPSHRKLNFSFLFSGHFLFSVPDC